MRKISELTKFSCWVVSILLAIVVGLLISDIVTEPEIVYRYIYYTGEKVFDDNISLDIDETEDYIIDTTGEELYFYDTDSIVRIEMTPAPTSITFGNDVGKLSWEEGIMRFEGDADKSAIIFFEYFLRPYIDGYIESEMEKKE